MAKKKFPKWFFHSEANPKYWVKNVEAGKHPLGFDLPKKLNGKTCKDCLNNISPRGYRKCVRFDIAKTGSTDIRNYWAACVDFNRAVDCGFPDCNCPHHNYMIRCQSWQDPRRYFDDGMEMLKKMYPQNPANFICDLADDMGIDKG